jgi:hypothetical protein
MLDFSEKLGLFDDFEVNHEPFWPRISKLLAGSVVLHGILIACAVLIPPVREALSIAAMFSGAGFVDRPYSKTQIADEAELIAMTGDRFRYPDGYWALDQGVPIPFPTPLPFATSPATVTVAQPSPTPTPTPVSIATPTPAIAANATPQSSPAANSEDQKVQEELDRAAAENGVKRPKEINTRPFKDLLAEAKKKKDKGELNLSGQIEVTVEADRDPDGKLQNATVKDPRGDKALEAVARDFVSALSDSGVLDFLEGTRHLKLTVKIDDSNVEVVATTEVESEERARQMEKGYSLLIVGGRIAKRGKDEEVYYNHTQVTSQGKEVNVKFSMPRSEIGPMLSKYSAEK